jgi:Ca2+/Na+ antiporter
MSTKTSVLDVITAGAFKTGKDGRKVFFPWGVFGRGYTMPTEDHFKRIRLQFNVWTAAMVLLIVVMALAISPTAGAIAAVASLVVFVAWMPFMLRGCERTDETMSVQESVTNTARVYSGVVLWVWFGFMLAIAAVGIAMLVSDRANAMPAIFAMSVGVVGAAMAGWMLMIRRRATGA